MSIFSFPTKGDLPDRYCDGDEVVLSSYRCPVGDHCAPGFRFNDSIIFQGQLGDCFLVASIEHVNTHHRAAQEDSIEALTTTFVKVRMGGASVLMTAVLPFLLRGSRDVSERSASPNDSNTDEEATFPRVPVGIDPAVFLVQRSWRKRTCFSGIRCTGNSATTTA
jgi:hypothetical protein